VRVSDSKTETEATMRVKNEGTIDRFMRAFIGVLIILSAAAVQPGKMAVEMVGLYFVVTAIVGWCPLYRMVHLDTLH
jgi:hypothetical protein